MNEFLAPLTSFKDPTTKTGSSPKRTGGKETTEQNEAIGPTITTFDSGDLGRVTDDEGWPPIQSAAEWPHWYAQTLDNPLIWYGAGAISCGQWLCRRSIQHLP